MATDFRPIPRLAVGVYPLTNVTPFTYRDGVTYERLLHQLIDRMNTIIGEVNTNNQALFDVVIENMNITIDAVNAALGEQTDEVDQKLADLTEYVDVEVAKIVDMRAEMIEYRDDTEAFRNQAETFSATTVELQDEAVAALIDTPGSDTRTQLNGTFVESALHDAAVAALIDTPGSDTQTQLDTTVAELIDTSGSDTQAQLNATIDGRVGELMPRTIEGEVPAAMGWTDPIQPMIRTAANGAVLGSIGMDAAGFFHRYSTALVNPDEVLYVNPGAAETVNGVAWGIGNSVHPGTDPAQPLPRLANAFIRAATRAPGTSIKIVLLRGDYGNAWCDPGGNNPPPNVHLAIVPFGGTVKGGAHLGNFTAAPISLGSPCFEVTAPGGWGGGVENATRVFDEANRGIDGEPQELAYVESVGACSAQPGSAYLGSDGLFIHRFDGAEPVPENTTVTLRSGGHILAQGHNNIYIGNDIGDLESKILIRGGSHGVEARDNVYTSGDYAVVLNNVEISGTGAVNQPNGVLEQRGNGVISNRPGIVACFDTHVFNVTRDAFAASSGNSTPKRRLLTVNCRAAVMGHQVAGDSSSNNGWTIHTGNLGVDIAGDYRRGHGNLFAIVRECQAYAFGTVCTDDYGDEIWGGEEPPNGFWANEVDTTLWCESTRVGGGSGHYSYRALRTAQIRVRNVLATGLPSEGPVTAY